MDLEQKTPLNVYVLFNDFSRESKKIYFHIYSLLCRDVNNPLSRSVGIPVFAKNICANGELTPIDFTDSKKTVVIVLVDLLMYSSAVWENYVKDILAEQKKRDDTVFILPVILCKYGIQFVGLQNINCIKYPDYNISAHINDFDIRLYNFLIRTLEGKSRDRLQIFISHSKKDGEQYALSLRSYLSSETRFEYFFDANNIQDGEDFAKVIKSSVENSFLIILHTDSYSERDWCQKEIIYAKENNCPVIVVDFIEKLVKRCFPYLGNVPWIKYADDWTPILQCLLRDALCMVYQKYYLKYACSIKQLSSKKVAIVSSAPEVISVGKIQKSVILYPEPPLGIVEKGLLTKHYPRKSFFTVADAADKNSNKLTKKKIAFSISNPHDWNIISSVTIKDMVIELFRHIVYNGAAVIYGGDLRKKGFTRIFSELSKNYKENVAVDIETTVYNYLAWNLSDISEEEKAGLKYNGVKLIIAKNPRDLSENDEYKPSGNDVFDDRYYFTKSLTQMRKERNEISDALIVLGGKTTGYHGVCPGTLEEFLLAVQKGIPVYVIGGFGGMAAVIVQILQNKCTLSEFQEYLLTAENNNFLQKYNEKSSEKFHIEDAFEKIKNANNINVGLSSKEQEILVYSNSVLEITSLVIKGLDNYFQNKESK